MALGSRRSVLLLLLAWGAPVASAAEAQPRRIRAPRTPPPDRINDGLPIRSQAYAPVDDEEYFQTWNAYLQSTAGHHVFANFAVTHMGIGDNTCGMNLALATPDGRTLLETFQLDGTHFEGATDRLYVRCEDTVMSGDSRVLRWRGSAGSLALDVTLTRGPPGSGAGRIWLDEDREGFARYNVPHLGSTLEGRIRYDGRWHAVEGTAAVEHFVGNVSIHRFSKLWHRVRVMSGDTALLAGGFDPAPGYANGLYFLFLARKGRLLHVSNQLSVRTAGRQPHEESGYRVPSAVTLSVDDGRLRLKGRVARRRLVGEFDVLQQLNPVFRAIIRVFIANPWIFRNDSTAEIVWTLDGGPEETLRASAMHEVIYVNE